MIGLTASVLVPANTSPGTGQEKLKLGETVASQVSPTGAELENSSQYRFSKYKGSLMFGPYLVDGEKYFYHENRVLNKRLEPVENSKVKGLHNFYLKTYMDPLFYSPTNGPQSMNLTYFDRFEQKKILSKYCGLEYDLIPEDYFKDLEENHESTEKFLKYASYKNAEELQAQNLNTTKSYSDYISRFISHIKRDVSSNRCFPNSSENLGIARATRTPTQYRIDTSVLLNYSRMANKNTEELVESIQAREKILEAERDFEISTEKVDVQNYTYGPYKDVFGPQEAKTKMNQRRINELKSLSKVQSETDQEENADDQPQEEEDDHTHESGAEAGHTHESSEGPELTLEQWKKVRLVDRVPVQYDIKPSCMEKETIPLYGWDKNIYPNLMLGQDIFFKNRPPYLSDFFTVSRCPYVELTTLKWYLTDGLYKDISKNPVSTDYSGINKENVEKAEKIFLNNPGEETLSQLSNVYKNTVKENIRSGTFNREIPTMWRRSIQQESKLHEFEPTYDDFYNKEHIAVWDDYFPNPKPGETKVRVYNNFILTESLYALTFMTWSDSVWRLDEKPPKFAGEL